MRILEVITGGEPGGAQRHVAELVEHLAIRNHEVAVVHGGGHWLTQAVQHYADVYYLSDLQRDISWHDAVAFRALLRLTRHLSPDIIHAHSSKAGILSRLVANRLKIPVVYTAHGLVFFDTTRSLQSRMLYRALEFWGIKRSQGIITLSDQDFHFVHSVRAQVLVYKIPNGVAVQGVGPRRLLHSRNIGFIGRFSPEKGLDVIIKAAEISPYWQWIIAGDGPSYQHLVQSSRHISNLHWMGWVENTQEFFQGVNLIVQPSYKEGLPYTVLDAMAAGLPVVGTPVGALREILGQVDPRLVCPVGDPQRLIAAIAFAFEHYDELSRAAYTLVKDQYDVRRQLEKTMQALITVAES